MLARQVCHNGSVLGIQYRVGDTVRDTVSADIGLQEQDGCLAVLVKRYRLPVVPHGAHLNRKTRKALAGGKGEPEPDPLRLQQIKAGKRSKRILFTVVQGDILVLRQSVKAALDFAVFLADAVEPDCSAAIPERAVFPVCQIAVFVHRVSVGQSGGCIQQSGAVWRSETEKTGDGMRRQHLVRLGGNSDFVHRVHRSSVFQHRKGVGAGGKSVKGVEIRFRFRQDGHSIGLVPLLAPENELHIARGDFGKRRVAHGQRDGNARRYQAREALCRFLCDHDTVLICRDGHRHDLIDAAELTYTVPCSAGIAEVNFIGLQCAFVVQRFVNDGCYGTVNARSDRGAYIERASDDIAVTIALQ